MPPHVNSDQICFEVAMRAWIRSSPVVPRPPSCEAIAGRVSRARMEQQLGIGLEFPAWDCAPLNLSTCWKFSP